MRNERNLRNIRHLDKFVYTLTHRLFYQPFESKYQPLQDYVSVVMSILGDRTDAWETERIGLWFYVHPKTVTLPSQGWKIHISATSHNNVSILQRVARIATERNISFKFAIDSNIFSMMNFKNWYRGASGKFITIYPIDIDHFKSILELLYVELADEPGPYILSDQRYRDCSVIYYRYGGIAPLTQLLITGIKTPIVVAPDGKIVRDIRTPYFSPPPWVIDPFISEQPVFSEQLLNNRYLIKHAKSFSNSGGVYLAEDKTTGHDVVIKEARAHTVTDDHGLDAISRLHKEFDILGALRETGVAPVPIEIFHAWEHAFLAEEYIEGIDLREVMLAHNPLMKVHPSLEDGQQYYDTYRAIFKDFALKLDIVHRHGIIFGDLSVSNIRVDPTTYTVRIIDFEGATRYGIDKPTFLYTPGFSDANTNGRSNVDFDDDLYGLAAIMLYMIFPIAAFAELRSDLFEAVLRTMLADIGWSDSNVYHIINMLSLRKIRCNQVAGMLDEAAQLRQPSFSTELKDQEGSPEALICGISSFILANIKDSEEDYLLPSDPFGYQTNRLSLGFGACGVLYSLKKCGIPIPAVAHAWVERHIGQHLATELPPGLLTGSAGIAWCLFELGFEDLALMTIKMANESDMLMRHHSYFYGMAGIGMANIYFHRRTKDPAYLRLAETLAFALLEKAKESDAGIYWDTDDIIHVGCGYGQSGVALFLLRLFEHNGNERFLRAGRRALGYDLSHGFQYESGVLSFPCEPSGTTYEPYYEEGTAGIAKVAMRYGVWDQMELLLSDVHRKYSVFSGLLYGLSGFIDALTDAYLLSGNTTYLELARRPIAGLHDLYLFNHASGTITPGDGLFRASCDYATGGAGVLRSLYRYVTLDAADFMLDEVSSTQATRKHSDQLTMTPILAQ